MRKYAVFYAPGFYGESESMIHIHAPNETEAVLSVMVDGVGIRDGEAIIPQSITGVRDVTPASWGTA